MAELNERDTKLVQYLNEAYGKEKQLEIALESQIAMTTRAPYKKRLKDHLKETKAHAREVERRIKKLGGTADGLNLPGGERVAEAAGAVQSAARKAAALSKGPIHAVRGTSEPGEAAEERQDRIFGRGRGDRHLHGDRGHRRVGRRQGDGQARAHDPPRGGAHGELPRQADPAAVEGGRHGGDPVVAALERPPPERVAQEFSTQQDDREQEPAKSTARKSTARKTSTRKTAAARPRSRA